MTSLQRCQLVLNTFVGILLLIDVSLVIYALATPYWRVLHETRWESYAFGLWEQCFEQLGRNDKLSYSCSFKIESYSDKDRIRDDDGLARMNRITNWEVATIVLLSIGIIFTLVAIIANCLVFCFILLGRLDKPKKLTTAICAITSLISCFIFVGALANFVLNSYQVENRFILIRTGRFQVEYGVSFKVFAVSCSISALTSLAAFIMTCLTVSSCSPPQTPHIAKVPGSPSLKAQYDQNDNILVIKSSKAVEA